jgi:adenylyltransferase/sulfurtransferase
VDGSDNYATRYAVNDACATLGKRWVYGSVERFSGQVSVFGDPGGPCYRCLFPEPPTAGSTANCEEIGVLGAIPGTIGSFQAVEALKCILDLGRPLVGRMLLIDFSSAEVRTIQVQRRADCRSCSLQADHAVHGSLAAAPATLDSTDIEPTELASRLTEKAVQLLDVREPWEWSLARIGQPHLLAMNALSTELDSLDRSRELIVYCHHGVRSHLAAEWLRAQGFRARNLAGGIDRWSREIDPSVPRY